MHVATISIAAVKSFRLTHPERVDLTRDGVAENRLFFLVGPDGERLRSSLTSWPTRVRADYDRETKLLRMRFPDGVEVEGPALADGEAINSKAGSLTMTGRVVPGPWEGPLSALAGHPVRLVRADRPTDGMNAPVTLVSDGSLVRFAHEVGLERVDPRRFRILFEFSGGLAHEEDGWEGGLFRIGEATIRIGAGIPRCAVTTRDPDTGERDLDTLGLIAQYRGQREGDGGILFGVYATVEEPGAVAVGDRLARIG